MTELNTESDLKWHTKLKVGFVKSAKKLQMLKVERFVGNVGLKMNNRFIKQTTEIINPIICENCKRELQPDDILINVEFGKIIRICNYCKHGEYV